jgi:hypothetical protein
VIPKGRDVSVDPPRGLRKSIGSEIDDGWANVNGSSGCLPKTWK